MSELAERLHDFTVALEAADRGQAETLALDITARFEELTAEESARVKRSIIGHDVATDDERLALDQHALSSMGLVSTEASFLMAALAAIEDPEGPDPECIEQIRSIAEEFEQRSSDVEAARSTADGIAGGYDLPPQITLRSMEAAEPVLALDDDTSVEVAVENVGDWPADDVEVVGSTDGGAIIAPEGRNLGTITGGSTESAEFTVEGTAEGDWIDTITVNSPAAGTDVSHIRLTVEDDPELVDEDDDDILWYIGGIGAALVAAAGAGYVLKRRLSTEPDTT